MKTANVQLHRCCRYMAVDAHCTLQAFFKDDGNEPEPPNVVPGLAATKSGNGQRAGVCCSCSRRTRIILTVAVAIALVLAGLGAGIGTGVARLRPPPSLPPPFPSPPLPPALAPPPQTPSPVQTKLPSGPSTPPIAPANSSVPQAPLISSGEPPLSNMSPKDSGYASGA